MELNELKMASDLANEMLRISGEMQTLKDDLLLAVRKYQEFLDEEIKANRKKIEEMNHE